jgi:hypothetical protein
VSKTTGLAKTQESNLDSVPVIDVTAKSELADAAHEPLICRPGPRLAQLLRRAQGLLSEFPTAAGTCEPSYEGRIGGGVDCYFSSEGGKRSKDGGGIGVLDVEGREDESGRR